MSARWLRLDTTWSSSEWLAELSPASRLVWVELLCYTKAHGYNGRVRSVSHSVFALRHVTGVTRNDVTELIEAAKADEALIEDGDEWVLTGWPERNGDPTASERQKRYRKSKSRLSPLRESRVTDRYVTPVTPTETETTTGTETKTTTTRTNAHASGDFNELYQSHPSGPLVIAEQEYHRALPDCDHETMLRRWPEYAKRQKAAGLNVPHLANWLKRGGWADSSLDEEQSNGIDWGSSAPDPFSEEEA